MKILFVTQKINKNDPVLGFFHGWIAEFSKQYEKVTAVCLEMGVHSLPANVSVFSLGKEKASAQSGGSVWSKICYAWKFLCLAIAERKEYDAVFVHMNQEYILVAGWFWRLWGKRVYMWRNHHVGNTLTDIAAFFCTNVFCPSKFSYTAKYKKTIFMPVGIDTELFKQVTGVVRAPHSILFIARIAPIKKPDLLVEALGDIKIKNIPFVANFYGDPLPKDSGYYDRVKTFAKELELNAAFHRGIPNTDTPKVYSAHEIMVNLSSSGMYDKTIFEAMACGTLVLASNKNLHGLIDERYIFEEGDKQELVDKLGVLLALSPADRAREVDTLRKVVIAHHSLAELSSKLAQVMSGQPIVLVDKKISSARQQK